MMASVNGGFTVAPTLQLDLDPTRYIRRGTEIIEALLASGADVNAAGPDVTCFMTCRTSCHMPC